MATTHAVLAYPSQIRSGQTYEMRSAGTTVIVGTTIGSGTFGTVWSVQITKATTPFSRHELPRLGALKFISKWQVSDRFGVPDEVEWLSRCVGYKRILQLIDYTLPTAEEVRSARAKGHADPCLMILTEYANGGTLGQWIEDQMTLDNMPNRYSTVDSVDAIIAAALDQGSMIGDGVDTAMIRGGRQRLFGAHHYSRTAVSKSNQVIGILSNQYALIRTIVEQIARSIVQFRIAISVGGGRGGGDGKEASGDGADEAMSLGDAPRSILTPVHVDIKFDNFLVHNGVIILADFGLTVAYESATQYQPLDDDGHLESWDTSAEAQWMPASSQRYSDPASILASKRHCVSPNVQCTSREYAPGYKADEYSLGMMLYMMGIDYAGTEFQYASRNTARGMENRSIHEIAYQLLYEEATNAPLMLQAIVGLTHPVPALRWSMDMLLDSQFINPLKTIPTEREPSGTNSSGDMLTTPPSSSLPVPLPTTTTQTVALKMSRGALGLNTNLGDPRLTTSRPNIDALLSWVQPDLLSGLRWSRVFRERGISPAPPTLDDQRMRNAFIAAAVAVPDAEPDLDVEMCEPTVTMVMPSPDYQIDSKHLRDALVPHIYPVPHLLARPRDDMIGRGDNERWKSMLQPPQSQAIAKINPSSRTRNANASAGPATLVPTATATATTEMTGIDSMTPSPLVRTKQSFFAIPKEPEIPTTSLSRGPAMNPKTTRSALEPTTGMARSLRPRPGRIAKLL